jgi:hypothetical protein
LGLATESAEFPSREYFHLAETGEVITAKQSTARVIKRVNLGPSMRSPELTNTNVVNGVLCGGQGRSLANATDVAN